MAIRDYDIISFYTKDTPYEIEANEFKKNLKEFGFSTKHISPKPNLQNWHKNCCHKPFFIDEKLKELNKPLVWIDCDARICKAPVLFQQMVNSEYEFGVHFRDHIELLSGTLFFRPTKKVFKLLHFWKHFLKRDLMSLPGTPQYWQGLEQSALQYLVTEKKETFDLKGLLLPKEYVYVADMDWWSDVTTPVIAHGQASRRYKGIV